MATFGAFENRMARRTKQQKMFEATRPPKVSPVFPKLHNNIAKTRPKSKVRGSWSDFVPMFFLLATVSLIAITEIFRTQHAFGKFLIVICIVISAIGFVFFFFQRLQQWLIRDRWVEGIEMQAIDEMDGHEFEEVCAEIYRKLGYGNVTVTQKTRDQGADITMENPDGSYVVQAKRQLAAVGNWAVQEAHAARSIYKATHAIVITNNTYTSQAVALAKACEVELVDRTRLAEMLAKSTQRSREKSLTQHILHFVLRRNQSISAQYSRQQSLIRKIADFMLR